MEPHLTDDQLEEIFQGSARTDETPIQDGSERDRVRAHLAVCERCQLRLEERENIVRQWASLRESAAGRQPDCPPEEVWMEIAAGIFAKEEERYLDHAAKCDHCGPLLRSAGDAVNFEPSPDDEEFLSTLASASPAWQQSIARTLSGASRASRSSKTSRRWLMGLLTWPRFAFVLTGLLLTVAIGRLAVRMLQPASAEQLLAQAYTERRTLDVRIPGAQPTDIHVERNASESDLDKPASLLKAEVLIAENLKAHPDDPTWLASRGRAELLDGSYDAAVKTLERAQTFAPASSSVLADLGAAYYMRAKSSGTTTDYFKAVETLSASLKLNPNDPVALFNLALVKEKACLVNEAKSEWEQYLRVDPHGPWAVEARSHLTRVQHICERHRPDEIHPLLSPDVLSTNAQTTALEFTARTERYLDLAFKSWLPKAVGKGFASPASSASLHAVELLGGHLRKYHGDPWLSELIAEPRSPALESAISDALKSDDALLSGHYGAALSLGKRSSIRFEQLHRRSGVFWSKLLQMRAESAALRFSECLAMKGKSFEGSARSEYPWLNASMMIEKGDCLSGLARLNEAIESNRNARELARASHYTALELRAAAYGAMYELSIGDRETGLDDLRAALDRFWESDMPDAPGENLYASLLNASDGMNWPYVDISALRELQAGFPSRDPVDRAVEAELVGEAQVKAGEYRDARASLAAASESLESIPADAAVQLRSAEVAVEDAQILNHLGKTSEALARLSTYRRQFDEASPGRFQAEFFKTLGETYLLKGDESDALPVFERALSIRESGLEHLGRETEKLAWSRDRGDLYRDLLKVKLKTSTPREALAWWEWYKAASLRQVTSEASQPLIEEAGAGVETQDLTAPRSPTTVLLSYAFYGDSTTIFVVRNGTTTVKTVPLQDGFDALVRRFLYSCSDPSIGIDVLSFEGRELYQLIVEPVESEIHDAQFLHIETDGVIDRIPFSLLCAPDGLYLGDKMTISYSMGADFDLLSAARARPLSPASAALIVVSPGGGKTSLPLLEDVSAEGSEVASHFRHPVLVSPEDLDRRGLIKDLRNFEVFHFAGHSASSVNRLGLVLAPGYLLEAPDFAELQSRNLQLAVLSACDSANGSEGTVADIDSLARTLVAAGVPHVIASRWRVDSAATRRWMRYFYSALMDGESPAESLRVAVSAIRKDPSFSHPYYWASFAAFGNS